MQEIYIYTYNNGDKVWVLRSQYVWWTQWNTPKMSDNALRRQYYCYMDQIEDTYRIQIQVTITQQCMWFIRGVWYEVNVYTIMSDTFSRLALSMDLSHSRKPSKNTLTIITSNMVELCNWGVGLRKGLRFEFSPWMFCISTWHKIDKNTQLVLYFSILTQVRKYQVLLM